MRTRLAAALLLGCATVLGGCGSGQLSVQDAATAYQAAVEPANDAKFAMYDAIGGKDNPHPDLADAKAAAAAYLAALRIEVAALGAPAWPSLVRTDIQDLIAEKQAQIPKYEALARTTTLAQFAALYDPLQNNGPAAARIRSKLGLPPATTYNG